MVKLVYSPNFEIQTKVDDGIEKKSLIIFDENDRNFCYSYYFVASENLYKCIGCFFKLTKVTAKFRQNPDGADYVILSSVEHECYPKKYVKPNENILQPLNYDELQQRDKLLNLYSVKKAAEKAKKLQMLKKAFHSKNVILNQNWSFPETMIFYMTKNLSSAKLYAKLIQSCKYFFFKKPIIVMECLFYQRNNRWTSISSKKESFNFSSITRKQWISGNFIIIPSDGYHIASSIIEKLYRCNPDQVIFYNQILPFNDFRFLVSSAKEILFVNVTVINDDDSIVPFEKLFKKLSNVKNIKIESNQILSNVTFSTFKELIKIPQFLKLESFWMNRISEAFDIDSFYVYMKKNKLTKFHFEFDESIPEFFKNHLDRIIDEIILIKNYYYKAPILKFPGLLREKCDMLEKM